MEHLRKGVGEWPCRLLRESSVVRSIVQHARGVAMATLVVTVLVGCGQVEPDTTESTSLSRSEANARSGEEYARCMQDRGWNAEWDGVGVQSDYPLDQEDEFRADEKACREETGFGDFIPYSAAELDDLYDAMIEVAECMQENGLPVDDPPSREFYAEVVGGGGLGWHPYDAVYRDGIDAIAQAEAACPLPDL